jgi:hypothetical protein
MAVPNKKHKRKRHNYLVDYQAVPEDETEEFVYFTDLLGMYDNVDRPKDPFCRKTGDPKSLFLARFNLRYLYEFSESKNVTEKGIARPWFQVSRASENATSSETRPWSVFMQ